MSDERIERARVIDEALTWRGTPFRWEGVIKNVGVDCGRFLALSFNGAGVKAIDVASFPKFPFQWFLHRQDGGASPLLDQLKRFAVEYELPRGGSPRPADLVVAKEARDWAHCALVIEWPKVIGAAHGAHVVTWRDIRTSPQYMNRELKFLNPWDPAAGGRP